MKKYCLIFSLFLVSSLLYAQVSEIQGHKISGQIIHYKKDVSISLSPNILFNTPDGRIIAGGMQIRMFVGRRFSFDSDLMIGRDFLQLGPGIFGLPALLLGYNWSFGTDEEDNTFTEFLVMGIAVLLSAEHFSYHFPVTNNTEISPYVSLLRYRNFGNAKNGYGESSACFAVGCEVNKYFKRFILSPYMDYTIGYSSPINGFTTGINCGYYLPGRR
jgi:hypothetical protein